MLTAYPNRTSPVLRGAWIQERYSVRRPRLRRPTCRISSRTSAASRRARCERASSSIARIRLATRATASWIRSASRSRISTPSASSAAHDPDTRTPIDASGTLPDGTAVASAADLRRALAAQPDKFVQALTESLLTFALGRTLDYRDMPTAREIVRRAAKDDYRFESIVLGVVSSDAFRKREADSGLRQASLQ